MVILKNEDKEFKLVPRTRKVIQLTETLKAKNLNEIIFNGLNENDLKVLANIIKEFAENEDGKSTFTTLNNVYDFIDKWKEENNSTSAELYKECARVVNEMGFFKTKMTEEELEKQLENPMTSLDINQVVRNSVQAVITDVAKEEFQGFKG